MPWGNEHPNTRQVGWDSAQTRTFTLMCDGAHTLR